ncbi:MAG: bifunctional diaminohydroxyphosphoribosylaminopyrimidine deaminase/5-amino-6-(5-phosphoribosylamino)uracil reductase RibD [Bacteroidaceae bacterium]|nr:bifunctional diaminohydroxyphosphoribosylaminopyrimidine deaminase/5-amino-6-(5-phosphoribosylamino)uracil reductase RibD [Bacteroidaceae bacterium]
MNYELKYMWRCIQLAKCGTVGAPPNPMVGAVIVYKDKIIGEGYHRRCGGPHAEVNAIRSVRNESLLKESIIYVSLEPCSHYGKTPPCADLIIEKKIPRVVVGCMDPFAKVNGQGIRKLRDAGIEVVVGVLEKECLELNKRFITFHQQHRPFVTLKWAQSEDGFMDAERRQNEEPVKFSSHFTQTLVHRMRAMNQAIMVGTKTVLMDNPTLTTRLWEGPNPLRVTIDRNGVLPDFIHLKDGKVPTVIYNTGDLRQILADLYKRGVQSLMVEGGAQLLQHFIDEGLWDEARVEVAPFCLGSGVSAPNVRDGNLKGMLCVDARKILNYSREM